MEHYERYVQGEISKEEFRAVQDIAIQAKETLIQATESKAASSSCVLTGSHGSAMRSTILTRICIRLSRISS